MVIIGTICLSVAALAVAAPSHVEGLPPEPMPSVLLRATEDASFLAQQADEWAQAGVGGFLLDVFPETAQPAVSEGQAAVSDTPAFEAFCSAVRQLRDAGLDANFGLLPLAPEQAHFTNSAARESLVDHVTRLSRASKRSGLRGIVIDTRSTSLFYSYDWDGYRSQIADITLVSNAARSFGRELLSAVYPSFPRAQILVIVDNLRQSGPFWLPMFNGMLDAIAEHPDATLHLLTRETRSETKPRRLAQRADIVHRFLRLHLPPTTWETWRSQGTLALGCAPLTSPFARDDALVSPVDCPPEALRVQLAAAKLLSPRYIWLECEAPLGQMLSALSGRGYGVSTLLDRLQRIGPVPTVAGPAWVLRADQGVAVAFLEGVQQPLPLTDCQDVISVTDLATGQRQYVQVADGDSIGLFEAPVLLDGLSVRQWVVPACLWLETDDPVRTGSAPTEIRFGLTNRTGMALMGSLHVEAEGTASHCTVKPSAVEIDLDPGEGLHVRGSLRGRFRPGDPIDISLRFITLGLGQAPFAAVPRTPAASRSFSVQVQPELLWTRATHGPILATPAVAHSDVVVASWAGEVALMDVDGNTKWRRSFPARFEHASTVARHWTGEDIILSLDHRGTLRALQPNGHDRWRTALGQKPGKTGPLSCDLARFPGHEIVVGFEDGTVKALFSNAQPYWQHACEGAEPWVSTGDLDGDGFDEIVVLITRKTPGSPSFGVLTCLDSDGNLLWENSLGEVSACAAMLTDLDSDGFPEVVTGTRTGNLAIWSGQSGALCQSMDLSPPLPIRGITPTAMMDGSDPQLLVACDQSIVCLSASLGLLWQTEVHCAAAPVVADGPGEPRILLATADGALVCLDATGQRLWVDRSAVGMLPVSPLLADVDSDGLVECIFGSTDRFVRCLEVYE